MHVNGTTQATLAVEVLDKIIQLDAVLSIADADDLNELQERIAALDPSEVRHILAMFGAKSAPTIEAVKGTSRHDA